MLKISQSVSVVIKAIIFVCIVITLYFKFQREEDVFLIIESFVAALSGDQIKLFVLAVILMPINWLLEAFKWKILIERIQHVTLIKALVGVLTGLAVGFVTPRHLGDYFGRIWQLENKQRTRVVGALVVSRITQLLVTIFGGLLGLVLFKLAGLFPLSFQSKWAMILALSSLAVIVVVFWFRQQIFTWARQKNAWAKVVRLFEIIVAYKQSGFTKVMIYAISRYIVFTSQFMLVCMAFGLQAPVLLIFAAIALIFLFKSILPSFNFLSDLGVRELGALLFLSLLGMSDGAIVSASLCVWVINILFPTLVGSGFVWVMKIRGNK